MTTSDSPAGDLAALRDVDVDLDSLFAVFADPDRRFVLACLDEQSYALTLRDLATRLVRWKNGGNVADVSAEEFEISYLLLYHRHVPRLVDANVVEYDPDRNLVRLPESGDEPLVTVELAKLDGQVAASQTVEG